MNIKPDLQEEYDKYVNINNQDPYSQAVVKAGHIFMDALDAGLSPEEAEKKMMECDDELGGLTGYMVSVMISAIVHFHERGEEVRVWWNGKHGVGPEKDGVVNSAIIEVKEPGE